MAKAKNDAAKQQGPEGPAEAPRAADPRDAEISALRRQVEEMRRRASAGLAAEAGAPRPFRVKLPGVKVRLTAFACEPRLGAPAPHKDRPQASYAWDDLPEPERLADPQAAAWAKYAADNGLRDEDRRHYHVTADAGAVQDHLDVVAVSPADAFEIFKAYNGILATQAVPAVEALPVPDAPETAAG